ncbi:hypothetical protein [Gardnerella vaginalis]|uniref:hypothetical protein n=1 Tax=Gardnerella vaginalis TaxID=2702 RepID=UPI000EE482C1|nr:hypothetical protein CG399_02035 [Bifidobacteriaceae bacterium NR015]
MSGQDELDSKIREAQHLEFNYNGVTSDAEEFAAKDEHLSLQSVRLRIKAAKAQKKEDENNLRKTLAEKALLYIKWQLIATNVGFILCLILFPLVHYAITSEVFMAWFTATIVEIIGILWVIARSLFPFHDSKRDKKAEKR